MKPTRPNKFSIVTVFGIFFTILAVAVIAAPVLEYLGAHGVAHAIYTLGGFLCHQMYTRSAHLFDLQVAVCTRDLFMYIAMSFSAFVTAKYRVKRLPFWVAVLLILPAAIDGTTQLVSSLGWLGEFVYHSTSVMRAITGSLYGLGLGFFLYPLLTDAEGEV